MPRPTIADAAAELLADAPALTAQEIGRALAAQGLTRAKDPARAVAAAIGWDGRFRRLRDGRWTMPLHLLDGSVLTHVLSDAEVTAGALALDPDLTPFSSLVTAGLTVPDGGPLEILRDADAAARLGDGHSAVLLGPEGWLPGRPGSFLHVRLDGRRLVVSEGARPAPDARLAQRRIAETARQRLAADMDPEPDPVWLDQLILDAVIEAPGLLDRPLAPLGEILEAAGLEVHGADVGLPGTDWEAWDELWSGDLDDEEEEEEEPFDEGIWDADEDVEDADEEDDDDDDDDVEALAARLGLEELELAGLRILAALSALVRDGGAPDDEALTSAIVALSMPRVASLAWRMAHTDPHLGPLAETVLPRASGPERAPVLFVLSGAVEAADETLRAEELLRSAVDADAGFAPALVELARFEQERGRLREALGLLRAAGTPVDDRQRAWLEQALKPVPGVGRNEPCPCGSGRKAKRCHPDGIGDGRVSAVSTLLALLAGWLERPDLELEAETLVSDAGIDPDEAQEDVVLRGLVMDVLLHDRGLLERYLRTRGELLPSAERELLRSWVGTRRSLYEVEEVRRGEGVTIRDLLDGSTTSLEDPAMGEELESLDLACLRLVPDGTGVVAALPGFVPTRDDRRHVTGLLRAGDGLALLRWVAGVDRSPVAASRADIPGMEGDEDLFDDPALAAALEGLIRDHERRWVDEPVPALGGLTPREALRDRAARDELERLLGDIAWEHRRADGRGRMDPHRVRALLGLELDPTRG